jgi:palmitoyl-protein thioesterase
MMHGMGDFANNPMGMVPLRKLIAQKANAYVASVALCSNKTQLANCDQEDQMNGFSMVMDDEVDQFARVVQADAKLSGGFNAIGFSQGNAVIRGYIHRYNDPPVKKFVSMHGVLMGVSGLPQCPMNVTGLGLFCRGIDAVVSHLGVYSSYVQSHLAQANYFRDAENLDEYRKKGRFLPYINNEVKGQENSTYTDNFKSLEKLVLVMAEDDTMVHPKESEHFGYFRDGSRTELVAMQDAPWYTEDWFGLKSLDAEKKIDTYTTPGNHLRFTEAFLGDTVQKYFAPAQKTDLLV